MASKVRRLVAVVLSALVVSMLPWPGSARATSSLAATAQATLTVPTGSACTLGAPTAICTGMGLINGDTEALRLTLHAAPNAAAALNWQPTVAVGVTWTAALLVTTIASACVTADGGQVCATP